MANIYRFSEYTKESTLTVDPDGNVVKQVISYYKDVYPEKYGLTEGGAKFSWVIKEEDTKIAFLSGLLDEEVIIQFVEALRAQRKA